MKIARMTAAALLLLMAGAAAAQPEPVAVPVPTGWTAVDEEYRYGRENLWEYINGAAELFLEYGFRELVVRDMEMGDAALSVSVYDMSRKLDAFGVYETESPANPRNIDGIGAGAVLQPPYRGLLWKDRFYVKLEVGGGNIDAGKLESAMRDIAAGLPGDDELPAALAALPTKGRRPGSVAYTGANYLGMEDLRSCLHARYGTPGNNYEMFVMPAYTAFLRNEGGRWTVSRAGHGEKVYVREIPYSGPVVLMGDDKQLLGVSGMDDVDGAIAFLAAQRRP